VLDRPRVAEGDEEDVLEEGLEGHPELALAHEGERAVGLAVEAAHARDEAGLARVEPGELHRPLDGVGPVGDEEAHLEVAGGQLPEELGEGPPQGIEELLGGEGHPLELRLDRPHDLRVVDPRRIDPVAPQAVDEAATREVLELGAPAAPLDGRELPPLGHGLAVLQVALVVVEPEVVEGIGDDLPALVFVELVGVDDPQPAAALLDELLPAHPLAVGGRRGRHDLQAAPGLGGGALHVPDDRATDDGTAERGGHDRLPGSAGTRGPGSVHRAGVFASREPGA